MLFGDIQNLSMTVQNDSNQNTADQPYQNLIEIKML